MCSGDMAGELYMACTHFDMVQSEHLAMLHCGVIRSDGIICTCVQMAVVQRDRARLVLIPQWSSA